MIELPETWQKSAKSGETDEPILPGSPSLRNSVSPLVKDHPLVKLTDALDWNYFEQGFSTPATETGRPALPVRLMVGLH